MTDIKRTIAKPAQVTVSPAINMNPSVGVTSRAEQLLEETQQLVEDFGQEVVQKLTFLEFPNIGDERYLYIDQEMNKSYRWDATNLKYYCVGSNYEDINLVDGGGANNE